MLGNCSGEERLGKLISFDHHFVSSQNLTLHATVPCRQPTGAVVLAMLDYLGFDGGSHGHLIGPDTGKTTAIQDAFWSSLLK